MIAPAKDVVEYRQQTFTWNFWDKGEYMGYPTDEKDKLWSDLYNCKCLINLFISISFTNSGN